ncbi:MAG TPA: CpsB/CapC family capsule biosynthesis tyrosine phosphatase, partial [Longimicrobium sp.]|nr:CpsB/CapC family capsule biosynthesis tyrosine phosphatase [Longimicrobium sp.]
MPGVVDLHNHLLAGVDDGAAEPGGSRAALRAMAGEGVEALVVTPHLAGSLTAYPDRWAAALERVDAAWAEFAAMAAAEFPAMRVERGAEVMLDVPAPDLGHPALRLAGSPFVLVEFPGMRVPPRSANALRNLRGAGWIP